MWRTKSIGLFWSLWLGGLALWALLLAFSAGWDLEVSRQCYRSDSMLARLVERWGEAPAWCLLIWALLALVFGRRGRMQDWTLRLAAAVALLALVEPLLLTQTLKFFWGRVRFRDLSPDLSDYTPFFVPAGPGRGESFPSGHVAMAFVTCAAAFAFQKVGKPLVVVLLWLLVLSYGAAVFAGRLMAGAHYLTDCLFAAGSCLLLGALVCRAVFRRSKLL